MKPSRFTEEQIIGILREQEAGAKTRSSAVRIACRSSDEAVCPSHAGAARLWSYLVQGGRSRRRSIMRTIPSSSKRGSGLIRLRCRRCSPRIIGRPILIGIGGSRISSTSSLRRSAISKNLLSIPSGRKSLSLPRCPVGRASNRRKIGSRSTRIRQRCRMCGATSRSFSPHRATAETCPPRTARPCSNSFLNGRSGKDISPIHAFYFLA